MWAGARSAIVLGVNYGPDTRSRWRCWRTGPRGAISVYAQGDDYHEVIKGRLKTLARWLAEAKFGGEVKVFVDTAPLMEKPLAERAGPRLAGQAHQPGQSRELRLLAVPGLDPDRRWSWSPTRPRPTTAAPAGPASTSARPTPSRRPTSSMRGAASPT